LSLDSETVLTVSADKTARLSRVPHLRGDPEQVVLWITGLELDAAGNALVLDGATWHERRQRLQKLGGPPER